MLLQAQQHAHADEQKQGSGASHTPSQGLLASRLTAAQQLHPYRRQFRALRRTQKASQRKVSTKQPKPYIRLVSSATCHPHQHTLLLSYETQALKDAGLMLQRERCKETQATKTGADQCISKNQHGCSAPKQMCTSGKQAQHNQSNTGQTLLLAQACMQPTPPCTSALMT